MRRPLALALALTASLVASAARAQPALEVSVSGDCALDDDVASRVHEAAVRETLPIAARATLRVTIACETDPITVRLVARADGTETARDLALARAERDALTDAVVLSALLALDELDRLPPPEPAGRLASAVSAPPEASLTSRADSPSPSGRSIVLSVGGGALLGIAGTAAPALTLRGGYRWDDVFSMEVEGVGTIPDAVSAGGGRLDVATLGLRAAVCADASLGSLRLGGCLGAWGGALSVASQGFASEARQTWAGWAAADGRVRATLVIDALFVQLEAALLGVLVAPVLVVDAGSGGPVSAGRAGPLAGWLGLSIGLLLAP